MFKKLLMASALCLMAVPALADWVTILSIKQVELGYNSSTDGAVIGGVASAVDGGDGWDIIGSAVAGAVIGNVLSDNEKGVEIRIRNAKGRTSTIVQPGEIHHFRLGSAELEEMHHNGERRYRVRPNA